MVHCIFVVFELFSFGGKNIPSKTTCLTGLAILVLQTQQLKLFVALDHREFFACNLSSSNPATETIEFCAERNYFRPCNLSSSNPATETRYDGRKSFWHKLAILVLQT